MAAQPNDSTPERRPIDSTQALLAADESEGTANCCRAAARAVQWRDVFTAANFFVVTVGSAFAVDLGHMTFSPSYNASGAQKWGGIGLMTAFAVCALVSVVWSGALLFAHDALFRALRIASIGLACILVLLGALAIPKGLIAPTTWYDQDETAFIVKICVITVLTVVCQALSVVCAKKMLDDVKDEVVGADATASQGAQGGPGGYEYD